MKTNRDNAVIAEAAKLEDTLRAAVRSDYPDLCGWLMQRHAIVRTGSGEDDWRWDGSRRGRARQARKFIREAIAVAAGRISQAYGLGVGEDWACRRFGQPEAAQR